MFLHRNENIKWGKGIFNATSSSISRNKYCSILISNTQLGIRRCKASSPSPRVSHREHMWSPIFS